MASSDDRVMIQKRNRMQATHKKKMKRFFSMADKSQNGSIDIEAQSHMDLQGGFVLGGGGKRLPPLRRSQAGAGCLS